MHATLCAIQALYWGLISVVLLAGASSSVGSLGAAVAVEREYSKTLCGDDSAGLRKLNSGEDLKSAVLLVKLRRILHTMPAATHTSVCCCPAAA